MEHGRAEQYVGVHAFAKVRICELLGLHHRQAHALGLQPLGVGHQLREVAMRDKARLREELDDVRVAADAHSHEDAHEAALNRSLSRQLGIMLRLIYAADSYEGGHRERA